MTWHDYFKFGFQSASDSIIPRTASPSLKPFLRLARMRSSFLLSGVIHYYGPYMLPGPAQPCEEFLFFVSQGIAVYFRMVLYNQNINERYRRTLSPLLIFFLALLHWATDF